MMRDILVTFVFTWICMYQSKSEDTIKILCIQKSEGTLISSVFLIE